MLVSLIALSVLAFFGLSFAAGALYPLPSPLVTFCLAVVSDPWKAKHDPPTLVRAMDWTSATIISKGVRSSRVWSNMVAHALILDANQKRCLQKTLSETPSPDWSLYLLTINLKSARFDR